MPDEFDFSELRNYIQGQMDMGGSEILFDEPWTLSKPGRAMRAPSAPARPVAAVAEPAPSAPVAPAVQAAPTKVDIPVVDVPSARTVKKVAAPFEGAQSLDEFYGMIAGEAIYAGAPALVRYEGPEHPRFLLLFSAPRADIPEGHFFESPVGSMLSRLFASLHVDQADIGVSYFFKSPSVRNIPPLLEAALRRMLAKELSLVGPQVVVTFGEPLFHQVFGKGKNFGDCAGTDMEFGGFKACALVDAFAMVDDKQLKLVTWKVHIPRCSYFRE